MKSYRSAFLAVLAVNLALIVVLGGLWRTGRLRLPRRATGPETAAAPPAVSSVPTGGAPAAQSPTSPPLVPLQLSPNRLQSIGVKTGVVAYKAVSQDIRTVGDVEVDERHLSTVQVRFSGWIQKVFADSTYQYIRTGQPLLTIYSPDLVTTEREYLLAKQNEKLLAASSVPGVATGAATLVQAAAERLKQWEIPPGEIEQLEKTGQVREYLTINSPVSGYITERNALPNMHVEPGVRLYTVADLSTVWVYAQVLQDQIGALRVGDTAIVTVDSYPGRTFAGRLDYIWPQVDMATRTVKVRLVFANPQMKLLPGMFVNVRLRVPLGRRLVIPATAVLESGTREIVFVDDGNGYLEPREVVLGARADDEYVVQDGLKAGEVVVTSANFLIDSESQLQAAIGSFIPPPPGAGAAAAMNHGTVAAQATVELSTDPSPPRKGMNSFRVKLTSASGAPISGAEVVLTFAMAAMPQMSMPAMRNDFALQEISPGLYGGQGTLQTGGTWQVTILARKSGQVLATRQMSVEASGGM